jgi:predicted nucleic acid-binding protein
MIFLDTGYFVALFSPDDDLHDRAVAWSLLLTEPFLVTEHVLWECVNTFSKPNIQTAKLTGVHVSLPPSLFGERVFPCQFVCKS